MNPLVLKVLAGVGVVSAGVGGGWYIQHRRKEKVVDEGDEQPPKEVDRQKDRKFTEFSGYQSNLQGLMHYLKDKVNIFNELSGKYANNKNSLNEQIKDFDPYIRVTHGDLKKCKCAAESGVKDMNAMDEFMGILDEIKGGKESEKISNFSELFKKVYEDLKRLEELVNSSLKTQ